MVLAPEEVVAQKDSLRDILAIGGFEDSLLAMHLAETQESVEATLEHLRSLKEGGKRKQQIRDTLIDLALTLDHLIHHSQEALALLEPELGLADVVTSRPVLMVREAVEEYGAQDREESPCSETEGEDE